MLFTLLSTFSYALCFTYNQEKKGFFSDDSSDSYTPEYRSWSPMKNHNMMWLKHKKPQHR